MAAQGDIKRRVNTGSSKTAPQNQVPLPNNQSNSPPPVNRWTGKLKIWMPVIVAVIGGLFLLGSIIIQFPPVEGAIDKILQNLGAPIHIVGKTDSVPIGFSGNFVTGNSQWYSYVGEYERKFNNIDMVLVPAGCFDMGSAPDEGDDDEHPRNQICFSNPFWIGRFEVTNAQFQQLGCVALDTPKWPDADYPRVNVTWIEATDCAAKAGMGLPSESQWEYAARGPDDLDFVTGTWKPDTLVWNTTQPAPVGTFPAGASWVGAEDVSGNVWEWTNTIYDQTRYLYPYKANDGREDPNDRSSLRVIRGGSWVNADSSYIFRTAKRYKHDPQQPDDDLGFRFARPYSPSDLNL